MKVSEGTKTYAVHCKTEYEFNRIADIFKMDTKFIFFDYYQEKTVLYPLSNQYGEIDGWCKEENYTIINSKDIES